MVKSKLSQSPDYKDPLTHPDSVQVMYRPVLQEEVPPIPNPDNYGYTKHKLWWKEQIRRCEYGWIAPNGTFINPLYYFFLNFCKVNLMDELNGNKWDWKNPYFRDGDKEYFDEVYYNMSRNVDGNMTNAIDLIVSKARRKGWTTSELYGITMWFFVFRNDVNISRAYPNDLIKNKERRGFMKAYSYIHPIFRIGEGGVEYYLVEKNETVISQGYKIGNEVTVINSIYISTISADGGSVRGDAIGLIVVVEAGLHKNLGAFKAAADEALGVGDFKFGITLIGGTSDSINNKTTDYKEMYYGAKDFGMTRIFTPAWKCWPGAIDYFTGKSLKEKAIESIERKREQRKKQGAEKLRKFLQENPFSPEEAFIPSGQSQYEEGKIDAQLMHILREGLDKEWIRGKFEWERDTYNKKTGRVVFHPHPEGFHKILDGHGLPIHKVKNLYVQGIDDVYKHEAPHSDSKNAMITWMKESIYVPGMSGMPVHYYFGRTNNMMKDWEEFRKAIVFYGNPDVMYEHNTEGFLGFCRKHGLIECFLWIKGQLGIRLSIDVVQTLTMLGIEFFNDDKHINITNFEIMQSFKYWGAKTNSDLSSAMHMVLLALDRTKNKGTIEEKAVQQPKYIDFGVKDTWVTNTQNGTKGQKEGYFSFGRG